MKGLNFPPATKIDNRAPSPYLWFHLNQDHCDSSQKSDKIPGTLRILGDKVSGKHPKIHVIAVHSVVYLESPDTVGVLHGTRTIYQTVCGWQGETKLWFKMDSQ